jgi:uncharacterized Zn finger protein
MELTASPECSFCHSEELELFYSKASGLLVQCTECGLTSQASNEHLGSETISLMAS